MFSRLFSGSSSKLLFATLIAILLLGSLPFRHGKRAQAFGEVQPNWELSSFEDISSSTTSEQEIRCSSEDPGSDCIDTRIESDQEESLSYPTVIAEITQETELDVLPQQGQQIVLDHQVEIASVARRYRIPPISLAAGIANQGNAFTRPYNIDFVELCLINLPDSQFTGLGASVGVAQITPDEMYLYLPGCDQECLFDLQKSIEMMAAKLFSANGYLPVSIDPTDRLMVLALAQNSGVGPARSFVEMSGDWQRIYELYNHGGYAWDQGDWDQLEKILNITINLSEQGYPLPEGVDLERWRNISQSNGQP